MAANVWAEKPLIDFCLKIKNAIVDGPFGSNLKTIHYRTSGIPIVTSGYVTDGVFRADSYLYVDKEKFRQEIRSMVQGGDIVMAKIGANCGASAILPKDHPISILSGNTLKISINEKENSTKYVWYFLDWLYRNHKLAPITSTGAQPAISIPSLKKLRINAPGKDVQQKIAEILTTWDESSAQLELLINSKASLKKGLMQKLLSGEMRFKGFNGRWVTKKISDLGKVVPGGTPDTGDLDCWNGDINWCTPTDITALLGKKYLNTTKRKISIKGLKNSSATLLPKYSVVVCTRATIGDCAINIVEMSTNQGFKSVVPNANVSHEFIYYLMLFYAHELKRLSAGSTFLEISKTDFENIEVLVPVDRKEQEKIALVLSCLDRQIDNISEQLGLIQKQKSGLMQNLLTGEVVKV